MGYSANDAQLMSVPPYVCACFFTIAASWYADRVRKRGIFMLAFQLIAIAGFSMLAGTAKPRVQYAGTILAAIGIYPQIPLGMAWNSANIGGSVKRGTGIAMQVSWTIYANYIVIKIVDFIPGHGRQLRRYHRILRLHQPRRTSLHQRALPLDCHHCVSHSCLTFFMSTWCRLENIRREKIAHEIGNQELTEEQKLQERELADNVPWFRYTT
jgi:hypothetical protein